MERNESNPTLKKRSAEFFELGEAEEVFTDARAALGGRGGRGNLAEGYWEKGAAPGDARMFFSSKTKRGKSWLKGRIAVSFVLISSRSTRR